MTAGDKRAKQPLDFHRWLQSRGMNPSRRRPLGRQAALLIEYRSYLERTVGPEDAKAWFEKYATPASQAESKRS